MTSENFERLHADAARRAGKGADYGAMARVEAEIKKVIVGKDDVIRNVLTAIIAGGHILLEDVPGVGKTTLAVACSKAMNLDYKRTQFTPDIMPSDVVGFCMYDKDEKQKVYVPGSILCNLYLADEINRTSSKTQSALLEAMEEGNITVEGETRALPNPFIVIATQNPVGAAGTQMLPDSQLDRFMVRLSMGYPQAESEIAMMKARSNADPLESVENVLSKEGLLACREAADCVFVHDSIYRYITELVNRTRNHSMIALGVSPRGSLALVAMAKAKAFLSGRNYVLPEDVADVFVCTVAHRLILTATARAQKAEIAFIAMDILRNVPSPRISAAGK
ncbi:MAG: MoxR family ATPase [Lachnospiraceae bacterium]|nr:MoxR family ATPase [Lachnospiraceae bacterium]